MAVTRSRITGKILTPEGVGVAGGTIRITLSESGSTEDGGTGTQRVGGTYTATIASDGSVDFYLVPNDVITPSGTTYLAEYVLRNGAHYQENWNLTTGDKEIGDITQV